MGRSRQHRLALGQLKESLVRLARQKVLDEARRAGWPLDGRLAVHLALYGAGLVGPTAIEDGDLP